MRTSRILIRCHRFSPLRKHRGLASITTAEAMKVSPIIAAALSAKVTSAWQLAIYSDNDCQTQPVFNQGGSGALGCTILSGPGPFLSYNYSSDQGLLQFFNGNNCGLTLVFQTTFSSDGCTSGLTKGIQSFAIVAPE